MAKIIILHSAYTTPRQMERLVGPIPGHEVVYPESAGLGRWDHLGDRDVPALTALGGDFIIGYSSGAFMAARMVHERQYNGAMFLAGGWLNAYATGSWSYPCPVMLVHGTADRQVPYDGKRTYKAGLDAALSIKAKLGDAAASAPESFDVNASDGCAVRVDSWGSTTKLYTVINGGHTWPGSAYNRRTLGRTSQDFSATDEAMRFFRSFM